MIVITQEQLDSILTACAQLVDLGDTKTAATLEWASTATSHRGHGRDKALEALREAVSVCNSVSMHADRRLLHDNVTMFLQTEEWCRWAEYEVQPKLRDAIAALEASTSVPEETVDAASWRDVVTADYNSDDLVWLYDQGSNTIDGPRPFDSSIDPDRYTHWSPCIYPSTKAIDVDHKALS